MNSNMFSQTDSRWRRKPYPRGRYTVGGSGCGLCAVTHVLIEQAKYKNATPLTFWSYMRQYATMGYGTKWVGIENGLKHFGHKSVKTLYCLNSKSNVYKEFNKGNRMAVALMSASHKAPDGHTVWTTGGHYIAFLDYKVVNGKHYFYVKDSGGRHRRGWYCVETTMGKVLKQVWIVERLSAPKPYTPKKISVDGNWGVDTTKLTQSILGVSVDGIISSQPLSNRANLPAADTRSWNFVSKNAKGSVTVKMIQKVVNTTADGIFGRATVKALQKYLNTKAHAKLAIDGSMGPKTVKAWQTWLNAQIK